MPASVRDGRQRWRLRLGAAAVLSLAGALGAQPASPQGDLGQVVLERADAHEVVLRLELPTPHLTGDPFAPVRWPGLRLASVGPLMRLPVTGALVAIPATGGVRVEVLEADYRDLPLDRRTFALLDPRDPPSPQAPVAGDFPGFLGPVRVMRLRFHPVQLLPREGVLRLYRRLRVVLRFDRPLEPATAVQDGGWPPSGGRGATGGMAALARAVVLNLDAGEAAPVEGAGP